MMNTQIAQEWVTRLRSDRYQQGIGVLRSTDDKFCCHGVLCEMAVEAKITEAFAPGFGHQENWTYGPEESQAVSGYLPGEVKRWIGIGLVMEMELANHNDQGNTFDEIAAMIEREMRLEAE